MTIEVGNIRDYLVDGKAVLPEGAVWVGRAAPRWGLKASPLGNPYRPGQWNHEGMRRPRQLSLADCLEAYHVWLIHKPTLACHMELARLRGMLTRNGSLVLLCGCETWDGTGEAPGKCHAEILKEYLEAER